MNSKPQQSGVPQNWTATTFTSQGIPAPAGSNENGEPYWIVNNQKIGWQQMQQWIWQQRQKLAAQGSNGSSSGFEKMPTMPQVFKEVVTTPDSHRTEKPVSPESGSERSEQTSEQHLDTTTNAQAYQQQKKPSAKQPIKMSSPLGHSVPLKAVPINDPYKLSEYYAQRHTNSNNPKDSGSYLTVTVGKVLRQIAMGLTT